MERGQKLAKKLKNFEPIAIPPIYQIGGIATQLKNLHRSQRFKYSQKLCFW